MSFFPRYPRARSQWREFVTPAIRNLVLACVCVFLIQTLLELFNTTGYRLMIREFGLVPLLVTHGLRIWQPVTYIFLHGGLWHILLNMLFLWMFGVDLERAWGTHRFYTYFFLPDIGDSDHWGLRCDLRNSAGQRRHVSGPQDLADSLPRYDSDEDLCHRRGRNRIFPHARLRRRRQRQ